LQPLLKPPAGEGVREEVRQKADTLQRDRTKNEADFERTAAGITRDEFDRSPGEETDLSRQLNEILKPLITATREATERPRRLEQLRAELATAERKEKEARDAIDRLESLIQHVPAGAAYDDLRQSLQATLADWKRRQQEAQNNVQVIALEQKDLAAQQGSVWETISRGFKIFFLTRGRNMLLAIVTAVVTFFGLRWLHNVFIRFSPLHRGKNRPFAARLTDVIWHTATLVGAVLAGLGVLYITGDWLLLGFALIILIALALAAKSGLPRYYRQARLLLNLGEVREGERVVINGVPWLVKRVNFYTRLDNPAMRGDGLRIPLDQLAAMVSRPHDPHEPWFPCVEGDWVQLFDGTLGKVVVLTPEFVQLVQLGGARKTYPTGGFLAQHPLNLSNGFRLSSVVGLDFRHQSAATSSIPDAMQQAIYESLLKIVSHDELRSLKVEFKQAGESALDYEIIADFSGEVADRYQMLARTLQRLAVDASITNGWTIAFPQIVIHQTGAVARG
jgi:hypothetical protein